MKNVPQELTIPALFDMHVHLRQGPLLPDLARMHARHTQVLLAMPNTEPTLRTGQQVMHYQQQIAEAAHPLLNTVPCLYLTPETTPDELQDAARLGVRAVKLYPLHGTTNSGNGFRFDELTQHAALFDALQQLDLVCCVHAELTSAFVLEREALALRQVLKVRELFPRLRVVLEHITTRAAVYAMTQGDEYLAATVTPHHLELTLDDVIGETLRPSRFCKPVAKRPVDREALWQLLRIRHPRVMLGSDSAPHVHGKKYSECGCAGCFTAPILPELLATLFVAGQVSGFLAQFACHNAREFWRMGGQLPSTRKLHLTRGDAVAPLEILPREPDSEALPVYQPVVRLTYNCQVID